MDEKFDVFISYRRSDGKDLARQVKQYLDSRRIRAYLDTEDMIDGEYFDTQLKKRVVEAAAYVLIATPEVFQFRPETETEKDWVLEEMRTALREQKNAPYTRKVIPFVPYGTAIPDTLPTGLEDFPRENRIDLKGTVATRQELDRLAESICFVNDCNLWQTGRTTLEQSKAGGGRFCMLDIEDRIMPLYNKKRPRQSGQQLPIQVRADEERDDVALRDALQARRGNLYLIGESGIGKTTAMISIMEQHYGEGKTFDANDEIPLFVELNRAPSLFGEWYRGTEGMESSFIRREIVRQLISGEDLKSIPEAYLHDLKSEFTRKPSDGQPKYLLLLDGLNEVNNGEVTDTTRQFNGRDLSDGIRRLIIGEINFLLTQCPNVRVMLTSRTDETEVNCSEYGIEKLYLMPLKEDAITEYLASKQFPAHEIKNTLADERLLDCIRIPLFLTMFAALHVTKDVCSRGEILRRFFNEHRQEMPDQYTQQSRIDKMKEYTVDKPQLKFILDFLLPAVGWHMERTGEFALSAEAVADIIEPILRGYAPEGVTYDGKKVYPAAVIGEYGKQCFAQYSGRDNLPKVAKSLIEAGEDMTGTAQYILNCSVDILGVIYRNDEAEYGFIHHHFRDYFAAVHDINLLRMAVRANAKRMPDLAFDSLAPFIANANRREKSVFIGEILGEHHNKPILKGKTWQYNVPTSPEDRNLLKRALDIFHERFGEEVGYGVFNLIEIWKTVREDLSGEDFSVLDLSLVNFNGIHLGHTTSDGADFRGAKVGMKNLICQGHSGPVTSVAFAPDGKTFLSGSRDNTVRVWDSATGQYLRVCEGHRNSVYSVAFAPDGKTFLSGSADGTVRVWSTETGECVEIIQNYPGLIVFGCDMRGLHPDSEFSDEDKEILRRYGATVD